MSYQDVQYRVDEKVTTITLNRPERTTSRNLETEIHRAFDEANADRNATHQPVSIHRWERGCSS